MMALYLILTVLVIAGLVWVHRRLTRFVPNGRVHSMKRRAHLRMRVSRGTATALEIVIRMGQLPAYRKSKRIRPSLSAWQRLTRPNSHSARIGRAQRGMAIRESYESAILLEGPPRSGKSGLISSLILNHDGPVLSTSTKPDMHSLSSGVRSKLGPLAVFCPAGTGGLKSTFAWSPTSGCRNPQVATRRGIAFAGAVSTKGTDASDNFWSSQAAEFLSAAMMAADIAGGDLRLVHRWLQGSAEDAEAILHAAGAHDQAMSLAHLRSPAEKTTATVKLILNKGLSFLGDSELAASVIPDGPEFDIPAFLASNGTLYMIASGSEESPTAPVFAALATEVFYQSLMIGRAMPGQRLDAPIRFALDELCTICPVPVAEWMSDAGGSGVTIAIGCHSDDQLKMKFGAEATGAIHGCAGTQVLFPGISDKTMLETASKICGDFMQRARGSEHVTNHPIFSESMIRQIPDQFGLVIKGNCSPTLAKIERGWKQSSYRRAKRRGEAVAVLQPVSAPAAVPAASQPAVDQPSGLPDPLGELLADSLADVASEPERVPASNPWGV